MNQRCVPFIGMGLLMCSTVHAVTVADYPSVFERGYQFLDPRPESEYVARETRLLIRFAEIPPADLTNLSNFVQMIGEKSGVHAGQTTIARDGRTIVFEPSTLFTGNEVVDVALTPLWNGSHAKPTEPIQYRFYVLRSAAAPLSADDTADGTALTAAGYTTTPTYAAAEPPRGQPMVMGNGVSVPGDFPHVRITQCRHPGDGHIFIGYDGEPPYALILDNSGAPVWYRRGAITEDFKVHKNGMITEIQFKGAGLQYKGYDPSFNWVKDFHARNGYDADNHDLQVLPDGGYLMLGTRAIRNVDMSRLVYGGHPDAIIQETCVQEFTAADELIFQWRAWENLDVTGIGYVACNSCFEISHMNAVEVDGDGHLLVSNRDLSEVTKINRRTGQVIWRLGGSHSDFTFVNDPLNGFSCQHDIRVAGPHRYTLFDNGTAHSPPVSRAVEYELDPNAGTATLVWEYRAVPDRYTWYHGNVQRLPNGNTLIDFVLPEYPKVTEVNAEGEIEFEMNFVKGDSDAYTAFRFPWTGVVTRPYLVVQPNFDKVTLLFNKFGDPNVAQYRVYGGRAPEPDTLITVSDKTLVHLQNLEDDRRYYFRVTAVDWLGYESAFSNEESILVYLFDPNEAGDNMVRNGDFSQGQTEWTLACSGSAAARWVVEDGRARVTIDEAGRGSDSIRLIQTGMKLVRGETYVLEFDAGAESARLIEVKVKEKNSTSGWDYAWMGPVYLTTNRQGPVMKHFSRTFVMQYESDLDACLEVGAGSDSAGLYLDNVSLVRQAH
ncbi:MAG: aryl-sulfate sulfotransferase [Sedimentisphaerales bacterium]|nr:aryl-sulfate sulfotransferase [Sedimentisphaerales bacterium]